MDNSIIISLLKCIPNSRDVVPIKGTVSRELRPMLLYIIGKLFSRPIVASLKIFILLKEQFAMYIKQFSVS